MKNKLLTGLLICLAGLLAGCRNTEEVKDPSITIGILKTTSSSAEVEVQVFDAVDSFYLVSPKSDGIPTETEIVNQGRLLEKSTFTLSNLEAATDYVLYVAALVEDGRIFVEDAEFRTQEEEVVTLADGFMAFDGLDDGSGMYRLNIMLSSKGMGDDAGEGYYDVVIFAFLESQPKIIDEHSMEVPYGVITPFYTNGQNLSPMMYYIGAHFKDEDGENARGTAAFHYNAQGQVDEMIVADDTENSRFEILDNGDSTYTVKGKIVDKTLGKSYAFQYVDSKPVFIINQDM